MPWGQSSIAVANAKNNFYFFSGTSIGPLGSGLQSKETIKLNLEEIKNFDFDCGKTADTFDESKVLKNYKNDGEILIKTVNEKYLQKEHLVISVHVWVVLCHVRGPGVGRQNTNHQFLK